MTFIRVSKLPKILQTWHTALPLKQQQDPQLIIFILNMINFLILAVFAYLIYRIIDRAISNLEDLFVQTISNDEKGPTSQQDVCIIQDQQKALSPRIGTKTKALPLSPHSSEVNKEKAEKTSTRPPIIVEKVMVQNKEDIIPPTSSVKKNITYQEFERQLKLQAKESSDLQALKSQNEEYRITIERMEEEIEHYKQQKRNYIHKIEDIIQHVVNSQSKPLVIPENQDDEEIKALVELTKGIDFVHHTEAEKYQRREQEFKEEMKQLQEKVGQEYRAEIQELQKEIRNRDALLDQKVQASTIPSIETEKLQVLEAQVNDLAQKLEEKESEAFGLQIQLKELQSANEAPKVEVTNSFAEQNSALRHENEQLKKNLVLTQKQLEDLKAKFNEIRNKSSISQNDKLEEEIRLKAHVQSLQQLKIELQGQVDQLNLALLKEEQDRNQMLVNVKEELTQIHEVEVENLNKTLQVEQEARKQVEGKLAEIQSELEFVQAQLKSTAEAQKTLAAELQVLKSPKKLQKAPISESDVKNHAQYQKLKRKVDDLENQIKVGKGKEQEVKPKDPMYSTDRKINYVRSKIDRQVSPTFQIESKERTPRGKIETITNKERSITSSIFTGPGIDRVEMMKSPIDLRYKTPMEKPYAASSILQGQIGDGYFGETNILNQTQREFIINEINHLKKITSKKTKMIYRSLNVNTKAIVQFISNVPNLLVVVELANKKILAAFTQAAFNKDLNNQAERKYTSANKSMILDVSQERVIPNSSSTDTIRYDEKALIWGKNEFAVSSEEPLLLVCDLNCEEAVYPSKYSSQQLLGTSSTSCPISQFEVFRIFLG